MHLSLPKREGRRCLCAGVSIGFLWLGALLGTHRFGESNKHCMPRQRARFLPMIATNSVAEAKDAYDNSCHFVNHEALPRASGTGCAHESTLSGRAAEPWQPSPQSPRPKAPRPVRSRTCPGRGNREPRVGRRPMAESYRRTSRSAKPDLRKSPGRNYRR